MNVVKAVGRPGGRSLFPGKGAAERRGRPFNRTPYGLAPRGPSLAGLLGTVLAAGSAAWAWRDYRAWRALGEGGLETGLVGWLQTSFYRVLKREPLSLAPFRASPEWPGSVQVLTDLPVRQGTRPRIDPHPVPHRQLDQHPPHAERLALRRVFDAAVAASPHALTYKRSYYEEHSEAVTLRCPACGHPHAAVTHGEVAHIHPFDGSMHMVLGVRDAAAVVAGGWGERHGLAGLPKGPPLSYVLVYAPRRPDEVEVVARILAAAIAHMTGERTPDGRGG